MVPGIFQNPELLTLLSQLGQQGGGIPSNANPAGTSQMEMPQNSPAPQPQAPPTNYVSTPVGGPQIDFSKQPGYNAPGLTSQALLSQAGAVQDPQQKQPAFRTADLVGLLGLLLPGNQKEQFAQGFLGSKVQKANQDTQYAQNQANQQRQGLYAQAKQAGDSEDRAAQQQFQAGQNQLSRDQSAAQFKAQQAQQAQLRTDALNETKVRNQAQTADNLLKRYQSAKTLGEMKAIAKNYNSNVAPDEKLDDATVLEHFQEKQTENLAKANEVLNREIIGARNSFGEVDDSNAKLINAHRKALAEAYGLKEDQLTPVLTGKTLRAQHYDDLATRWTQTFNQKVSDTNRNYLQRIAEYNLAKQRVAYTEAHGDQSLGLQAQSLGLRQNEFAYRQLADAQKAAKVSSVAPIKKIDEQIRGLNNQIKFAEDDKAKARFELQKEKLKGQREFLVGLLPPELQAQDIAANAPYGANGQQIYTNPVTRSQFNNAGTTGGQTGGYSNSTKSGNKYKVINP